MSRAILCIAGALALLPTTTVTANAPAAGRAADHAALIAQGKLRFERTCAPCHGQGAGHDGSPQLPGTAALDRKYDGERPGALELRDDLTPDILGYFVRNGSGPMPGFRKTEVSDAEITAMAAYFKDNAARAKR